MAQTQALQQIVEPAVQALGYEFVGCELHQQRGGCLLRIYIDSETGIGMDDCEKVSHQVSSVLDVEDPLYGQYTLEVSSPGLDRPLFTVEHYVRFVGNKVKLRLHVPQQGQRNFMGILVSVVGNDIELNCDEQKVTIHFADIEKGHLVAKF